MGPGTDLLLLAQDYEVVGSDFSQAFPIFSRKNTLKSRFFVLMLNA